MSYDSKSIKQFEGKVIRLKFSNKYSYHNDMVGKINEVKPKYFVFQINQNSTFKKLEYQQIHSIEEDPKKVKE